VALLDRAIVHLLPAVPRPIVRSISSRYIAGDALTDATHTVRTLNAHGKLATKSCGPPGSQDLTFAERGDRPPPSQGGDLPQRVAAHGRRPAYHVLLAATGRNLRQRFWLISAVLAIA